MESVGSARLALLEYRNGCELDKTGGTGSTLGHGYDPNRRHVNHEWKRGSTVITSYHNTYNGTNRRSPKRRSHLSSGVVGPALTARSPRAAASRMAGSMASRLVLAVAITLAVTLVLWWRLTAGPSDPLEIEKLFDAWAPRRTGRVVAEVFGDSRRDMVLCGSPRLQGLSSDAAGAIFGRSHDKGVLRLSDVDYERYGALLSAVEYWDEEVTEVVWREWHGCDSWIRVYFVDDGRGLVSISNERVGHDVVF